MAPPCGAFRGARRLVPKAAFRALSCQWEATWAWLWRCRSLDDAAGRGSAHELLDMIDGGVDLIGGTEGDQINP